jgi:hypothetical protein
MPCPGTNRGSALSDFNDNFTFLMRRHNLDMMIAEPEFDTLRDQSKVLVGSVSTVTDQLIELITVGRLNHFAGVFAWGSLTSGQTMASLKLFQSQVIPQVRAALAANSRAAQHR